MKNRHFSYITFTKLIFAITGLYMGGAKAQSHSYIQQDMVKVSGATTEAQVISLPQSSKHTTRTYFDGQGRKIQTVGVQGSTGNYDIVQPISYNTLGQQTMTYLPYVAGSTDGSFHPDAIATGQPGFYTNGTSDKVADDSAPYAQQVFENSPLQRLLNAGSVGANYQPVSGQHYKTANYRTNTGGDNVIYWKPDGTSGGYYSAGQLSVVDGKDEQNIETLTFTDNLGHLVLKRRINGSNFLDTYYVYTLAGMVAWVIPPKAIALMQAINSYSLSVTGVDALLFKYSYDDQGRLSSKTVPGASAMSIVYDPLERPVLMQDANMHINHQWNYIKYDARGRAISQGIYTDNTHTDQSSMQSYITNTFSTAYTTTWWETRSNNSTSGYYTNNVFPTTNIEPLAYSYYDDYDLNQDNIPDYSYQSQLTGENAPTANTRGMPTIVSKRTVGSGLANIWLTSVTFYDAKGRPIQTQSNNQLHSGVSDIKTAVIDFSGKTLVSKTVKTTSVTTTVQTAYTYNGRDQVTAIDQNYNGSSTAVRIATYEYNELGQLVKKNLQVLNTTATADNVVLNEASSISGTGNNLDVKANYSITLMPNFSVTNGATFSAVIANYLQGIDYRYNIRGQLLSINNSALSNDGGLTNSDNNDLFGMEMLYDQTESGLGNTGYYNGQLSAIKWMNKDAGGTATNKRSYKYTYDAVNRLNAANYQEYTSGAWNGSGVYDEKSITYDENGNIKTLQRNAYNATTHTIDQVDDLTYTYDSSNPNKLTSMADASGNNAVGFKNLTANTTNPYTYDNNGNLLNDPFKGMTLAYNYLNRADHVTINTATGRYINYTYDATGQLLQKDQYDNNVIIKTTDYIEGFVYEGGTLAYFPMPEGRVRNTGGTLKNEYIITDQQGNARISFEDNGSGVAIVRQETSYYAFGMALPNSPVSTPTAANKNLYNGGSEWQNDYGDLPDLQQTFYRNYDAALGRWTGVDPQAENSESLSTYNYGGNNPIMFNDPLGNDLASAMAWFSGSSYGNDNNNSDGGSVGGSGSSKPVPGGVMIYQSGTNDISDYQKFLQILNGHGDINTYINEFAYGILLNEIVINAPKVNTGGLMQIETHANQGGDLANFEKGFWSGPNYYAPNSSPSASDVPSIMALIGSGTQAILKNGTAEDQALGKIAGTATKALGGVGIGLTALNVYNQRGSFSNFTAGDWTKIGVQFVTFVPGLGEAYAITDIGFQLFTENSLTNRIGNGVDNMVSH